MHNYRKKQKVTEAPRDLETKGRLKRKKRKKKWLRVMVSEK